MTKTSDLPLKPARYPLSDGIGPCYPPPLARRRLAAPVPVIPAVAVQALAELPPDPPTPAASSSVRGQIRRMLLAVSDEIAMSEPLWPIYQAIIIQMPATSFVVLVQQQARILVAQWLALQEPAVADRVTLVDWQQNEHGEPPLSGWVQDPFIPAVFGGEQPPIQLLMPQNGVPAVPTQLAAANLGFAAYQAPVAFEGGNLLFGIGRYCIGLDTIDETRALITDGTIPQPPEGVSMDGYINTLYHRYVDGTRAPYRIGRPELTYPEEQWTEVEIEGQMFDEVFYLGNKAGTHQPIFHIDMFLTLLDQDEEGDPLVLLGSPIQAQNLMYGTVDTPPQALADGFNAIQTQLEGHGFVVRRNPLPLIYMDFPPEEGEDDARPQRRWFFASYNNCLVEVTETSKTVWMPTYGYGAWEEQLAPVDAANEALFQELGFTVIRMPDCTMLACDGGALHCITNYLQRG